MSMDINVYIDDFTNITKEGCEEYLLQFWLKAQVHPKVEFVTSEGFVPFRVEYISVDMLKNKAYITGFEIYIDKYDYKQIIKDEIKPLINHKADELLKRCNYEITLSFHEFHEGLIALAFASYLAETGNGVICYTTSGEYLYENIKQKSLEEVGAFFKELDPDTLHLFDGWH